MTADSVSDEEYLERLAEEDNPLLCPHCERPIQDSDQTLADEMGVFHHERCLQVKNDMPHTEDLVERRENGSSTLDSALRFQNGGPNPW